MGHNTQIDYLLVHKGDLRACRDCRAFSGEACSSRHRLVIMDVLFERKRHRRKVIGRPRILWKNLKREAVETFRATVSEKLSALVEDMSAITRIRCGTPLLALLEFCEEVQTKVPTKQYKFKELLSCQNGNQEDIDLAKVRYKVAKKEAKIVVPRAKDKAYEDLYKKVDTKEGANDIYKIAKARERKRRDIRNMRYIKNEGSSRHQMNYECYYSRINQGEAMAALQRMGRNKAVGPDQIPIEAWRGIKLLSHTMKLWERVIERRLRRETRVSENQFGFMPGWSTNKEIHLLRSLIKKYRERQRDLYLAFLDLEKAYDSVMRELVWRTLRDKGTPRIYSRVIKDMYDGVKTRVRTTMGSTEYFPVEVGLHQGSAISPYLFTLILDELSRRIQESIPWCMISADDIVLIAESTKELNNIIERWKEALEDNGLRDYFRYLGSMIHRSGTIGEDVAHRIGVSMLYGSECWPITKAQAKRVEVTELRMLRWTCGITMVDMIPNVVFRAELDVDSIIDKMREGRLRWFGHVKRRPQTAHVRRVEAMLVEGSRRRGRPKLRWENRLKQDMKEIRLSEDITSDRIAWRDIIRINE
nr:hypothetical protein [Tanacetum cinerariifolium]